MKKTINRFKWHMKELNKTFSNQPSYYSSKRLERFALFVNGILIFDYFCWTHRADMTFTEAAEALAINLLYAGFLVKQNQKEKNATTTTNQAETV